MSIVPRRATARAAAGPGRSGGGGGAHETSAHGRGHAGRKGKSEPEQKPAEGRSARHALLFEGEKRKRGKGFWITVGIVGLLLAGAGGAALFTDLDFEWSRVSEFWARMTQFIGSLEPALVLPLMALLPVAGFPISIVYLVAGARFGPLWGGVVVAGVTAVHLLLSHAVATKLLRGPIERFVARRQKHLPDIPKDEHAAVAVIGGLAPGIPYVLRNYLLALSGVPLRTYFWVCLPIYTARSYVTILLGDLSSQPSGTRLIILLVVDVVKIAVCGGVIWWLRARHRKHGAGKAGAR